MANINKEYESFKALAAKLKKRFARSIQTIKYVYWRSITQPCSVFQENYFENRRTQRSVMNLRKWANRCGVKKERNVAIFMPHFAIGRLPGKRKPKECFVR